VAFPIPRRLRPVLVLLVIVGLVALGAFVLRLGRDNYAQQGNSRFDEAREKLSALVVREVDRAQDYRADLFGAASPDACGTREAILRRDLVDPVMRTRTCVVLRGTLRDPYTAVTLPFQRGATTAKTLAVDHLVSLADAWHKGARLWYEQRRTEFANDPRNLIAASAAGAVERSFRDASEWLPPNEAFRCEFVARQIDVKSAYGLWVTDGEKRAMADVLRTC
jgi:Protein of unknown function (DUF1524)